ncbi:MAG: bi-domain-containing oxidoreductase [Thermoguttaceae bacterium]
MHQLTQKLKSGEMRVQEVPLPAVSAGMLLVRNHFSLISAGTEGATVKTARKGLVGKARERPEQVKQVLEVLKKQGPAQTFRAVMKRLEAYSPLGYSSAGEVLEVGPGVRGFAVGDKVACGGAGYASHAEIVSVPRNLCVKLPAGADLKAAAYNTLGAIALQGIRQADLRLGEACAVIGLGLLGQLTCLMLRASGVQALGVDVDAAAVETARRHACDAAWQRGEPGLVDGVLARTGGLGCDAVIITAASASLDPVNFAGRLARKKGRVVVVGAVPTGFDREPDYYQKELELRMSCSYGPGRYDLDYEEKGIDYPAAYVRWTENRNMEAFQRLVHGARIDLGYLTTHEFSLEEAPRAYTMIVERSEPFLGIVIRYDVQKSVVREPLAVRRARPEGKLGIAFVGAGSYAQGNLLPHLPRKDAEVVRRFVLTSSGTTSKRVAERFGFERCASRIGDILDCGEVNTVFVATRHDSHAEYVKQALEAGKHVFVEKPLCLTIGELEEIAEIHRARPELHLMVGFNRRFAPLVRELKSRLGAGPMAMLYRVSAGAIRAGTWIQDPAIGGGRIVGEACHFIDLMTFLCGALPVSVHAAAAPDPEGLNDTVNINLQFADGSIGAVCYFANGSKEVAKEYLEVHQSGVTAILHDYRELAIYASGRPERKKLFSQDKGQAAMVKEFIDRVRVGGAPLIPFVDIERVTQLTFATTESLTTRQAFQIGDWADATHHIYVV